MIDLPPWCDVQGCEKLATKHIVWTPPPGMKLPSGKPFPRLVADYCDEHAGRVD